MLNILFGLYAGGVLVAAWMLYLSEEPAFDWRSLFVVFLWPLAMPMTIALVLINPPSTDGDACERKE